MSSFEVLRFRTRDVLVGMATAAAALTAPQAACAQTAAPTQEAPPPPAAPDTRAWLVPASASLFAFSYGASALTAAGGFYANSSEASYRYRLWYPAIGPFLMLGNVGTTTENVLLALDGVAQCAGLGAFVYGLLLPKPQARSASASSVSIVPLAALDRAGAAVVGKF